MRYNCHILYNMDIHSICPYIILSIVQVQFLTCLWADRVENMVGGQDSSYLLGLAAKVEQN